MANVANITVVANLDSSRVESGLKAITNKKISFRLDDRFSGPLGNITASTQKFDQSLAKATNRVVAFGAAAAVFNVARRAFQAFAEDAINVEDSLTKINVNLGESADGLKKFSADLFNVARATGQSFETAAKAAEEFARQGLTAEQTIKRTRDALILSRLAAIDSAEAVNDLTAAVNSYGKEALTTTDIINKFVALDTQFAVNSKDLADGLQRAGAVAADAGLSLDKFLAIITAIKQETGRSGAVIGNGLKTIFERVKTPETLKDLNELGIATKDLQGELLPIDQILGNLAGSFDKLSQAQQKQISKSIANIQQINVFKVLLRDLASSYSITGRAAEVSANAQDQALKKNIALNTTLKSIIQGTQTTITQFFASLANQKAGPAFKEVLVGFESLRKTLSGESGSKTGELIGEGLLKGISNVLTGPGIAALGLALGAAFLKVTKTIGGELQSLLGLNTLSDQRVKIQENINNLLRQATKEEIEQLGIATTALQRAEALLAIKTRIAQQDAASNTFAGALTSGGRLGNTAAGRALRGNVPIFADPIQSAIAREIASGVPRNSIYIDRDSRLVGPDNPQGLLVANRRDEPSGGFQGVNRVIAQGGDPRNGGSIKIPNFADLRSQSDIVALRFGLARDNSGTAKTSVQLALDGQKDFIEQEKKLAATLKLVDTGFENFNKQLSEAATIAQKETNFKKALYGPKTSPADSFFDDPFNKSGSAVRDPRSSATVNGRDDPINEARYRRNLVGVGLAQTSSPIAVRISDIAPKLGKVGIFGSEARDTRRIQSLTGLKNFEDNPALSDLVRDRSLNRQARRNNFSLGASLALPIAAGFVEPTLSRFGVNQSGGTAGGIASGALQSGLQGAGIGAILGPAGAGIGAVVGALIGALGKSTKSLEEFNKEIDDSSAVQSKVADSAQRILVLQGQIQDSRKEGASNRVLGRLNSQLFQELQGQSDPTIRAKLAKGFTSDDERNKFIEDIQANAARTAAGGEFVKGQNELDQKGILEKIGNAFQQPLKAFGQVGNFLTVGQSGGLSNLGSFLKDYSRVSSVQEQAAQRATTAQGLSPLINEGNVGQIDRRFLINNTGNGPFNGDAIAKLTKTFEDLGRPIEVTEDNFRRLAVGLLDATTSFRNIKKFQDEAAKSAKPALPNLGAFSGASFTGDQTLAAFGLNRGIGTARLPNNARDRDTSALGAINKLEELGAFGFGGIKGKDDNDPIKIAVQQLTARISSQGAIETGRQVLERLPQFETRRFTNDRGETSESSVRGAAQFASQSQDKIIALIGETILKGLDNARQNIKNTGANNQTKLLEQSQGYVRSASGNLVGTGGSLDRYQVGVPVSAYAGTRNANNPLRNGGNYSKEQSDADKARAETFIKAHALIDAASKVLDRATIKVVGTINLLSDGVTNEGLADLQIKIMDLVQKELVPAINGTKKDLAATNGKPIPPYNLDSLITNNPFAAPQGGYSTALIDYHKYQ